jgi:mannose-1-phosphate guanylyltransferase
MKIIIRAGGVGTRLWPMSRQNNPKQFQAIVNNKPLIRSAVNRVKPLLQSRRDLFISVNREMVEKLKKEIPELPNENIIVEPASRNTGPAICLESCILAERAGEEVIVASLTSDDYIQNETAFHNLLRAAKKFLEKNPEYIVTPGVKPTYPDTGYSYIRAGESLIGKGEGEIFQVASWVEKPNLDYCKELIRSGDYFYHTGMYIWELKTILDLFKKFQPKIYKVCKKIAGLMAEPGKKKLIAELYSGLEKMTVESAITNKAEKIAVIISDRIGWSDVGKWHIVARILPPDKNGNVVKGKIISLDTKNCLIYGSEDKLIATIGLENMVIVLTEDALLVCPKERSAEVKKIVGELEKKGMKKYL